MLDKGIVTATICQEPKWQGSKSLELMYNYLSGNEDEEINSYYYSELNIKIKEAR